MKKNLKKHLYWAAPLAIIVLAIAWWLISPLFIVTEVSEERTMPLEVQAQSMGIFSDADDFHRASGNALVLENILRLEEFEVTNGPDLRIYLATDTDATEFVDLGKLKGSRGDQNYDIPANTDLQKYKHVLVWCRAFGVLFGSAQLG